MRTRTIPAPDHGTANRFGDDERARIRGRVNEVGAEWRRNTAANIARWEWLDAAMRLGAHSIGCSLLDLRATEIDEIRAMAADALGVEL